MYIYAICGNSDLSDFSSHARCLANLQWNDSSPSNHFGVFGRGCFPKNNLTALKNIVFVGHASSSHFGDLPADKFAKNFSREFIAAGYSGQDKKKIERLDLIGCGIGLGARGTDSLAQKIANELYKQGFFNIQVRTLANPENVPKGSKMMVELINQAGAGETDGYIRAYILNSSQAHELEKREAKLAEVTADISKLNAEEKQLSLKVDAGARSSKDKIQLRLTALNEEQTRLKSEVDTIRRYAVCFMAQSDPAEELKKAQNIFKPNETAETRSERIKAEPFPMLEHAAVSEAEAASENKRTALEKQYVISLLLARRAHEEKKIADNEHAKTAAKEKIRNAHHHPLNAIRAVATMPYKAAKYAYEDKRIKELMENLDLLIEALRHSKDNQWQEIIRENIPLFERTYQNLYGLAHKSSTLDLLKKLAEGELVSQEIAVESKKEHEQHVRESVHRKHTSASVTPTPVSTPRSSVSALATSPVVSSTVPAPVISPVSNNTAALMPPAQPSSRPSVVSAPPLVPAPAAAITVVAVPPANPVPEKPPVMVAAAPAVPTAAAPVKTSDTAASKPAAVVSVPPAGTTVAAPVVAPHNPVVKQPASLSPRKQMVTSQPVAPVNVAAARPEARIAPATGVTVAPLSPLAVTVPLPVLVTSAADRKQPSQTSSAVTSTTVIKRASLSADRIAAKTTPPSEITPVTAVVPPPVPAPAASAAPVAAKSPVVHEITPMTVVVPQAPVSRPGLHGGDAQPKANSTAAAPAPHQPEPLVDPRFTDLRDKITRLRDEYTAAIGEFEKRIKRSCFGFCAFFSTYEMNTKIAKRNAMLELLNASNLGELRQMAEKIQRGGGRVMRSARTHNVENLLHEILDNPAKSLQV